jgi:hypothetical protein
MICWRWTSAKHNTMSCFWQTTTITLILSTRSKTWHRNWHQRFHWSSFQIENRTCRSHFMFDQATSNTIKSRFSQLYRVTWDTRIFRCKYHSKHWVERNQSTKQFARFCARKIISRRFITRIDISNDNQVRFEFHSSRLVAGLGFGHVEQPDPIQS